MDKQTDNSGATDGAIIWNYHLDGHGGGQQQAELSGLNGDSPGFDWLHLRIDDPAAIGVMRDIGLDSRMIEALSAIETRPRMQPMGSGVFINLRGVNTNPGADPEDMVAIRIWKTCAATSSRAKVRRLLPNSCVTSSRNWPTVSVTWSIRSMTS